MLPFVPGGRTGFLLDAKVHRPERIESRCRASAIHNLKERTPAGNQPAEAPRRAPDGGSRQHASLREYVRNRHTLLSGGIP